MKKMVNIYLYTRYERFWHWLQTILIIILLITGLEVHGYFDLFGFKTAVEIHNYTGLTWLGAFAFFAFWVFTTGEWKQYIPTLENVKSQLNYYIFGIFRSAPHPTKKTVLTKLNPLQKLTYFGLKILVIPLIVTTGLLYIFYRYETIRCSRNRFRFRNVHCK